MPEEELEEAKEKTEKKKKLLFNIPTGWIVLGGILIGAIFYNLYFQNKDIRKSFVWMLLIAALIYFIAKQKIESKEMLSSRQAMELTRDYLKWCIRNGYLPDNTRFWVMPWGKLQKVEGKPKYYTFSIMLRYMNGGLVFGKSIIDVFDGNPTIQKTFGEITGREFPEITIPTYIKKMQRALYGGKKKDWF